MEIVIVDTISTDTLKASASKLDFWFYGEHGAKYILYEQRIMGLPSQVLLKDIHNHPKMVVTKSCRKMDQHRVPRSRGSIAEIRHILEYLEQLKQGYALIHAATITNGKKTLLLAAYPNVGKTSTCNQLLSTTNGWKYISDDTVSIHESGRAFLTSFPSAIGYYDFLQYVKPQNVGGWRNYGKLYLRARLHESCELTKHIISPPLLELSKLHTTAKYADITDVCCLEIGSKSIRRITMQDILMRIANINRYSLPQIDQNPMIKAYEYFNPLTFNIAAQLSLERENLYRFLSSIKKRNGGFYALACNDWNWKELLEEAEII